MRIFSVSELWGPYRCEHEHDGKKCGAETFDIVLTDEENGLLPEETGPKAITFILQNRLGRALCEVHQ